MYLTEHENDDKPVETGRRTKLKATPAMLSAGVTALEPFLLGGYQVFSGDHEEIVASVWAAMRRASKTRS